MSPTFIANTAPAVWALQPEREMRATATTARVDEKDMFDCYVSLSDVEWVNENELDGD